MMAPDAYLDLILRHGKKVSGQTFGEEKVERLNSLVWQRFYRLQESAPRFHERTNRGLFVAAVPLVALYQSLQNDFGLPQPDALDVAERMLREPYLKREGPLMSLAFNAMYQFRPVRRLIMAKVMETHENAGFEFEEIHDPKTIMAFDVHACPIVKFAREHGVPEVVPLICRLDDWVAEQLVGIELRRTSTIGMGAERCDFRYVRTK